MEEEQTARDYNYEKLITFDPQAEPGKQWVLVLGTNRRPYRFTTERLVETTREARLRLNYLEELVLSLTAELAKVKEKERSLREDLTQFSTFEQICNSGMLRNFKIDSESDFAKVILSLLQQTMELQISHLDGTKADRDHLREEGHQ